MRALGMELTLQFVTREEGPRACDTVSCRHELEFCVYFHHFAQYRELLHHALRRILAHNTLLLLPTADKPPLALHVDIKALPCHQN